MNYKLFYFINILFLLSTLTFHASDDFYSYYTKLDYEDGISGPFADIVISYGEKGDFIFSRESGYLPAWKSGKGEWSLDELVQRSGDGNATRPDKNNIYSYVRIIEESPEKIVVHWRYIPDFNNPNFDGVIHEYFHLFSDGIVIRKIKSGEGDLIDYHDPQNITIQKLQLLRNGIEELGLKEALISNDKLPAVKARFIMGDSPVEPVRWLKFDEGVESRIYERRNLTLESVTSSDCLIKGNLALWKEGVSGTALAFDGYYSAVEIGRENNPILKNNFSVEAWIALGAYPWMWGPIADLTEDKDGIYFGVNSVGQVGCKFFDQGEEIIIKSHTEIDLYEWTHLTFSINNEDLLLSIYIDGKLSKSANLPRKLRFPSDIDVSIGLNKLKMEATDHVSRDYTDGGRTPLGNQPMIYGIEGLLDEIKIYDDALSETDVKNTYSSFQINKEIKETVELEKRKLPGHIDGKNASKFGAYYTNLKYHELWDNLWRSSPFPDIVVRFDELPTNVVYWRGPNYGPGWVTDKNIWMSDQSCEIYHEYGCAEHMADKQNRHSHVRIIENNDARVVVHWRYASIDIRYHFENDRIWADEYHYIYPDGSAIRYVTYHDEEIPGWQDVQFFSEPGSNPEDQIHLQALTVANLKGDIHKMDWSDGVPENKLEDASISIVNFKSDYKVMVIYPEGSGIGAWGDIERATKDTYFAGPWNHWPVGQMPNDGRYAMRTDRVTHSALGGAGPRDRAIYGFTNKDISELIPLARFWNNAPMPIIENSDTKIEFKTSEKAYIVETKKDVLNLKFNATNEIPLFNPAFVLKNWNQKSASVKINGKQLPVDKNCRIGFRNTESGIDLVVWLKLHEEKTINLEFTKSKQ